MYVIHGVLHAYHDNSITWIVDVFEDEATAKKLVENLLSNLPARGGENNYFDPFLTDHEKADMLKVHARAVPNTFHKIVNLPCKDDKRRLNDCRIHYFWSNTLGPCVGILYDQP